MKIKQGITEERAAVLQDIESALMAQTNDEIDVWVEDNVTDLEQARALFKQMLKLQRNVMRHLAKL